MQVVMVATLILSEVIILWGQNCGSKLLRLTVSQLDHHARVVDKSHGKWLRELKALVVNFEAYKEDYYIFCYLI